METSRSRARLTAATCRLQIEPTGVVSSLSRPSGVNAGRLASDKSFIVHRPCDPAEVVIPLLVDGEVVDQDEALVRLELGACPSVDELRAEYPADHYERLSTMPLGLFVAQELEVVGSFGSTTQDVNELLDLVDAGRLDLTRSVSHTRALDEFPDALAMLESREGNPIRIVVGHAEPAG